MAEHEIHIIDDLVVGIRHHVEFGAYGSIAHIHKVGPNAVDETDGDAGGGVGMPKARYCVPQGVIFGRRAGRLDDEDFRKGMIRRIDGGEQALGKAFVPVGHYEGDLVMRIVEGQPGALAMDDGRAVVDVQRQIIGRGPVGDDLGLLDGVGAAPLVPPG